MYFYYMPHVIPDGDLASSNSSFLVLKWLRYKIKTATRTFVSAFWSSAMGAYKLPYCLEIDGIQV